MQIQANLQTNPLKPTQIQANLQHKAVKPCIYMGFKLWWHGLHAIYTGFNVKPLKTYANTNKSSNQSQNPRKMHQQTALEA